jgi:hypothetical protein
MLTNVQKQLRDLYENDFVLWVDRTVEQLQKRDIDNLDWKHLIEEIEGIGSEQRHHASGHLKHLILYLLLYRYRLEEPVALQQEWQKEIDRCRDELEDLLESKTLHDYCAGELETIYGKARKRAIGRTKLPPETFPEHCPFSIEQLLDFEFLP